MEFVNAWAQNVLNKWEILSLLSTAGSISKAKISLPSKGRQAFKEVCGLFSSLFAKINQHFIQWSSMFFKSVHSSAYPHVQPFVSGLLCRGVSAQPINLCVKNTIHIRNSFSFFKHKLAFLFKWLNKYRFDCLNSICIFIN